MFYSNFNNSAKTTDNICFEYCVPVWPLSFYQNVKKIIAYIAHREVLTVVIMNVTITTLTTCSHLIVTNHHPLFVGGE